MNEKDNQIIAFGYTRVSTSIQVEGGISLTTQANKISEYCKYKGYTLVHVYEDAGISGGTANRPSLIELMKVIKKGQFLICAELSRLSRNTADSMKIFTELKEKGAFLVSLNPDIDFSTPIGEMMYNVLMAIYQLERKQIGERVSTNMKTLKEQGKLRGRPPFGWKFVSKDLPFEKNEAQQEVIQIIIALHNDKYSLRQICAHLNENGYNKTLNREGQLFYAETIRIILAQNGITSHKNVKKIDDVYMDGHIKLSKMNQ